MNTIINSIIGCIFVIFESIFRRIFGGWLSDIQYKDTNMKDYIKSKFKISVRFMIQVLNLIVMFTVFKYVLGLTYLTSVVIPCIVQFMFWLPGHGPFFDLGRDKKPSADILKRYDEYWYTKYLKMVFDEEDWYTEIFDLMGMICRYTLPCILLIPFYGISILLMGIFVPLIYWICWLINPKKLGATELAEFISGSIVGICLYFIPLKDYCY